MKHADDNVLQGVNVPCGYGLQRMCRGVEKLDVGLENERGGVGVLHSRASGVAGRVWDRGW